MNFFDVVVVGAGPAGLGFCASDAHLASKKILLVDSGKKFSERNAEIAEQVGNGVTGAG